MITMRFICADDGKDRTIELPAVPQKGDCITLTNGKVYRVTEVEYRVGLMTRIYASIL